MEFVAFIRWSSLNKHFTHWLNQARPFTGITVSFGEIRISLTGRRGMNGIKRIKKRRVELQRVGLKEFKRKMRLRHYINANNFKASPTVSDRDSASATKQ